MLLWNNFISVNLTLPTRIRPKLEKNRSTEANQTPTDFSECSIKLKLSQWTQRWVGWVAVRTQFSVAAK